MREKFTVRSEAFPVRKFSNWPFRHCILRYGFLIRKRAAQLFKPCRKPMPVLLATHDRLARDPVELNYPAGPRERLMAVPRIVTTSEREQRSAGRGNFKDHVLEVSARTQQPEPTAGGIPLRIHVNENRNDLCLRICVDLAILFAAASAHRNHVRTGGQIDVEFFLKHSTKLVAAHFLNEPRKGRPITNLTQRKAAGSANLRIILIDCWARLGFYKLRNHQKIKRLASERRTAEPLQIERRKHQRRYTIGARIARWNLRKYCCDTDSASCPIRDWSRRDSPLRRDAQKRRDDAGAGDKCSAPRAGNFRFATSAPAMIYGNFEDPKLGARGFHLHLQIPAVCLLAHAEPFKRVSPDRAKRAHIGIADAIQNRHHPSGEAPCENLLNVHATWFALPARTRSDDEIICASRDWIGELLHKLGTIAAIAVEKNHDVGSILQAGNSGRTCAPVSARSFHNASPGFTSAFSCSIRAAVVDNDNIGGNLCCRDFTHNAGDRLFFIERWNDDRDATHRKTTRALVKKITTAKKTPTASVNIPTAK